MERSGIAVRWSAERLKTPNFGNFDVPKLLILLHTFLKNRVFTQSGALLGDWWKYVLKQYAKQLATFGPLQS